MSLRGKEVISVWERVADDSDADLVWRLRPFQNEYLGTRDELKYFRMINEHGKHFFNTSNEYLVFSGADPDDHENFPELKEIISACKTRIATEYE